MAHQYSEKRELTEERVSKHKLTTTLIERLRNVAGRRRNVDTEKGIDIKWVPFMCTSYAE